MLIKGFGKDDKLTGSQKPLNLLLRDASAIGQSVFLVDLLKCCGVPLTGVYINCLESGYRGLLERTSQLDKRRNTIDPQIPDINNACPGIHR